MRRLLVFAHRGEAQCILSTFHFKAQAGPIANLYANKKDYLLITGEGHQQSLAKVAGVLGAINGQIDEVLNLGICGALQEFSSPVPPIISVRTVYAEAETGMYFKSFTSEQESSYDCVSACSRVLGDEHAQRLSYFAHLVDRELWGVAYACHLFKKPWRAFKIISDRAGSQTDCLELRSKAYSYSQRLATHLASLNDIKPKTHNPWQNVTGDPQFYFTREQGHQLKKYLAKIQLTNSIGMPEILRLADYDKIKISTRRPKDRSKALLKKLKALAYPLKAKLAHEFEQLATPLQKAGIALKAHPHFEDPVVTFSFQGASDREFRQKKAALEHFDFTKIEDFLNGL